MIMVTMEMEMETVTATAMAMATATATVTVMEQEQVMISVNVLNLMIFPLVLYNWQELKQLLKSLLNNQNWKELNAWIALTALNKLQDLKQDPNKVAYRLRESIAYKEISYMIDLHCKKKIPYADRNQS